jgi:hypothetical protein
MVHQIDSKWNPIYDSILIMYNKLLELGFIYHNGKVQIVLFNDSESDDKA